MRTYPRHTHTHTHKCTHTHKQTHTHTYTPQVASGQKELSDSAALEEQGLSKVKAQLEASRRSLADVQATMSLKIAAAEAAEAELAALKDKVGLGLGGQDCVQMGHEGPLL